MLPKYIRRGFYVFAALGLTLLLLRGESARVRYVDSRCNYHLTYENSSPITLASFGGSRMLTAMDADDIYQEMRRRGKPDAVVYNHAHSHYTLVKEYILFRDLLENRSVKTAVIMIQPRNWDRNKEGVHPDIYPIARLKDIPTILAVVGKEHLIAGIAAVNRMTISRFTNFNPVRSCTRAGKKSALCRRAVFREGTTRNCHKGDYRPDLESILSSTAKGKRTGHIPLKWDLTNSQHRFTQVLISRIKNVAEQHNTAVFFLFLTRSQQKSPPPEFASLFRATTGMELLIPPGDMTEKLRNFGRRDGTHMIKKGRQIFIPWLLDQIKERCPLSHGCL